MIEHTTPANGNVFEDIGFPPGEAKTLKIRSMLMITAEQLIKEGDLTHSQAADLMGVPQSRITDLVRGRIGQFTIESLIDMLTNAGVPVEVRVAGMDA
jgi:predicted XRE-type DNA-binding protein